MDKLADRIPTTLSSTPRDASRNPEPGAGVTDHDRAVVAALFVKLRAMYPTTWARAFLTEQAQAAAMLEWAKGLKGVNGFQMARALAVLDSDFPPSLPRFRALCKANEPTTPNTASSLPQLPASREFALRALRGAREALRAS